MASATLCRRTCRNLPNRGYVDCAGARRVRRHPLIPSARRPATGNFTQIDIQIGGITPRAGPLL